MEFFGDVTSEQRKYQILTITSLPGKRFQSSYGAKVAEIEKNKQTKNETGREEEVSFSPVPLPLPLNSSLFALCLSLSSQRSRRTRAETLATQATLLRIRPTRCLI